MTRTVPYIDLPKQHAQLKKEILSAIEAVLDECNFILGPETAKFEKNLAEYCGTKYAIGVNSGTDALMLCLRALGVGPGAEVIVPPNSFLASASSVVALGATPVFADIRNDLNIDPERIVEKITAHTRAIIPVHLTGRPADMQAICDVAKKYNLFVVEDAAQAIGAAVNDVKVGAWGDAGCFSLHPLKTLNACGDGGAITTNDEKLYAQLLQLRNIGLKNRDESDIWGYNSRLDSMQAAILNVKIKYLEKWTEARRRNAAFYTEALSQIVSVPRENPGERCVYHTYVIQVDHRDALRDFLEKEGIGTKIHYPLPIHLQQAAKMYGYKNGDFPVCEKIGKRMVSLPVHQDLNQEDLQYVVEKIKHFYAAGLHGR